MEEFDGVVEETLFVWVRTLRGVTPEKWTQVDFGEPVWKRKPVFSFQRITPTEMELSLRELTDLYPPEKCSLGYPVRRDLSRD